MTQKEIRLARITETVNHDDGRSFILEGSTRIPVIREELKGTNYCEETLSLAILYSRKPICKIKGKVVVISTHIDTVEDIIHPYFKRDGNRCYGTFDNALTNHVALELMKRGDLGKKVIFAFTGDEEENFGGAKEVAEYLAKYEDIKPKYITLDVTLARDIDKYSVNIEYCHNKKGFARKIEALMLDSSINWGMSGMSSTSDETDMYCDYAKAVSICFPVKGTLKKMHSDIGVEAVYSSISEYEEFIHELLVKIKTKKVINTKQ